jgi:hypothetical protein
VTEPRLGRLDVDALVHQGRRSGVPEVVEVQPAKPRAFTLVLRRSPSPSPSTVPSTGTTPAG